MTELVAALRAVFHAWETGERLSFRGEYCHHDDVLHTIAACGTPAEVVDALRGRPHIVVARRTKGGLHGPGR